MKRQKKILKGSTLSEKMYSIYQVEKTVSPLFENIQFYIPEYNLFVFPCIMVHIILFAQNRQALVDVWLQVVEHNMLETR